MSFWSVLFGRRAEPAKTADPVEYKGFIIRADAYAAYDDAVTFTVNKARQIIDLQGEKIFEQTRP